MLSVEEIAGPVRVLCRCCRDRGDKCGGERDNDDVMQRRFHMAICPLLGEVNNGTVSDDRSQDILGDVLNAPRSSPLTRDELAKDLAKRKNGYYLLDTSLTWR